MFSQIPYRSRFLYRYISLFIITVVLITACQSSVSQNPALENGRSPSTDCRVVNHAGGETTICGQPQKVAVLEPKMLDILLVLGVQPSAYAETYLLRSPQFDDPGKQIPYLGKFVTSQPINLGDRNSPSLETLAQIKPDLILGVDFQENKLLSTIAPTVLIDTTAETWQDNIQIVAKALDRENDVHPVINSYEQQLAEVRTQLAPLVSTHPKVLNVISSSTMDYMEIRHYGSIVRLLEEIGFQSVVPEGVERKPGVRPLITLETLSQLDADIILAHTWLNEWDGTSAYEVPLESLKQKWADNPLLKNSRAWQEGKVYFVDYTLWGGTISGPMADALMLEKLPELLLPQQPVSAI